MLIVRRSKLYYTASGIITPIGGRPMHRLKKDSAGFVIPDGCITLIQFYLDVLVLVWLLCLFCITNVDVLLTVHLTCARDGHL